MFQDTLLENIQQQRFTVYIPSDHSLLKTCIKKDIFTQASSTR